MKPPVVSPETVMGSPIALHLARELAEQPLDSQLELNRTAVEIALSFSTGSALEDDDDSDAPADRKAAVRLAELLSRGETFITHRELAFPQAVVSASSDAPMALVPPRVAPHDERAVAGKPSGALWTSSFLAPGYPAWAAMVDTGYVPVQRPFACVEFFADPDEVEVFTIDSPADFVTLCDEFAVPSEQGDLSVDWRRVSDVYHAVHLTLQGLILVQDRPMGCRLGSATLRNWDSESTAWLRLPESAGLGRRLLVD